MRALARRDGGRIYRCGRACEGRGRGRIPEMNTGRRHRHVVATFIRTRRCLACRHLCLCRPRRAYRVRTSDEADRGPTPVRPWVHAPRSPPLLIERSSRACLPNLPFVPPWPLHERQIQVKSHGWIDYLCASQDFSLYQILFYEVLNIDKNNQIA